jgi:hypothetical protein
MFVLSLSSVKTASTPALLAPGRIGEETAELWRLAITPPSHETTAVCEVDERAQIVGNSLKTGASGRRSIKPPAARTQIGTLEEVVMSQKICPSSPIVVDGSNHSPRTSSWVTWVQAAVFAIGTIVVGADVVRRLFIDG